MKRWASVLAPLLLLTACTPQSLVTAWHWRQFTAHPDVAHEAALRSDLKPCAGPQCPVLANISNRMVDDLTADISAQNPVALRLAIHVYPLVVGRDLVTLRMARQISAAADQNPREFLLAAAGENRCGAEIVATPATFVGDDTDQYRILGERHDRLVAVIDPAVASIRAACLAAIEARRKALAPAIVPPPRPIW